MLDGGSGEIDRDAESITDPVLAGSLRVAAEIGVLVPVWERSPLQALARMHTLAAADLADSATLGRPLEGRPDLSSRLSALADLVLASPWPAPVQVAVVHGELLNLRAFGTADGVVARGGGPVDHDQQWARPARADNARSRVFACWVGVSTVRRPIR